MKGIKETIENKKKKKLDIPGVKSYRDILVYIIVALYYLMIIASAVMLVVILTDSMPNMTFDAWVLIIILALFVVYYIGWRNR